MLEAIFNFVLNVFFWLVGLIGSIVIYPIQAIIVTLVPSIGNFLSTFLNFMRESLFPMISFAKELFLEITCCPSALFTILITTLFARWAIAPAIRSILLIVNIWKIKSGGKTQ